MRTLYFLLGMILLIGMCQESAIVSLTAGGTAMGMYYYFKNKDGKQGKDGKDRGGSEDYRADSLNAS